MLKKPNATTIDIAAYYLSKLYYHFESNDEVAAVVDRAVNRYNEFFESAIDSSGISSMRYKIDEYFKPMHEMNEKEFLYSTGVQEDIERRNRLTLSRFNHPYTSDVLETHLFESLLLNGPISGKLAEHTKTVVQFDLRLLFVAAQIYAHLVIPSKNVLIQTEYEQFESSKKEFVSADRDKTMDMFLHNIHALQDVSSIAGYAYNLREFFVFVSSFELRTRHTLESQFDFFSRLAEYTPFRLRKSDASKIIESTVVMLAPLFDDEVIYHFVGSVFNLETLQYIYSAVTYPAYFTDQLHTRNTETIDTITEDFRRALKARVQYAKTSRTTANYIAYADYVQY